MVLEKEKGRDRTLENIYRLTFQQQAKKRHCALRGERKPGGSLNSETKKRK